ncbi:hypothetical protein LA6_001193 [Marinibacterium anthonyi]|nr:hypothetical protein LA6_001193 [Marinibacterium anthonyi]
MTSDNDINRRAALMGLIAPAVSIGLGGQARAQTEGADIPVACSSRSGNTPAPVSRYR